MNSFEVKYLKIASRHLQNKLDIVKSSRNIHKGTKKEKKSIFSFKNLYTQ